MGKRRSTLQKAQSWSNLTKIHVENHPTSFSNTLQQLDAQHSELDAFTHQLTKHQTRTSDLARRLRNKTKQLERAKNTINDLREEKKRVVHAGRVQKSRAVEQKENAIRKALECAETKEMQG